MSYTVVSAVPVALAVHGAIESQLPLVIVRETMAALAIPLSAKRLAAMISLLRTFMSYFPWLYLYFDRFFRALTWISPLLHSPGAGANPWQPAKPWTSSSTFTTGIQNPVTLGTINVDGNLRFRNLARQVELDIKTKRDGMTPTRATGSVASPQAHPGGFPGLQTGFNSRAISHRLRSVNAQSMQPSRDGFLPGVTVAAIDHDQLRQSRLAELLPAQGDA